MSISNSVQTRKQYFHSSNSNVEDFRAHKVARQRWEWLKAVLASPKLKPCAKVVATVLCQRINEKTGKAWPSHKKLAEDCASRAEERRIGKEAREKHDGGA